MINKKILKSRKAISPILATLLLIVIAVAAIAVTYAWVMTYMGSQTGQAGVLLSKDSQEWSSGKITLYIRNQGTTDATIDAVYAGTSSANLTKQTSITYDPTNKIVVANGEETLKITITYAWTSGTTYYFRIVPKVGAALEFNIKAP